MLKKFKQSCTLEMNLVLDVNDEITCNHIHEETNIDVQK